MGEGKGTGGQTYAAREFPSSVESHRQWKSIPPKSPLLSILRAYPPDRRHRMELKMWAKKRRAVERSRIPYVMNSVLPVGHERLSSYLGDFDPYGLTSPP